MQDILSRTWTVQEHIYTLKPSKSAYLKVLSLEYKGNNFPYILDLASKASGRKNWWNKAMFKKEIVRQFKWCFTNITSITITVLWLWTKSRKVQWKKTFLMLEMAHYIHVIR